MVVRKEERGVKRSRGNKKIYRIVLTGTRLPSACQHRRSITAKCLKFSHPMGKIQRQIEEISFGDAQPQGQQTAKKQNLLYVILCKHRMRECINISLHNIFHYNRCPQQHDDALGDSAGSNTGHVTPAECSQELRCRNGAPSI